MTINQIKRELANAFSEKNNSKAWYKYLEYGVLVCLILNAIVIFLSTCSSINKRFGDILSVIDVFTTVVFLIEVSLRIWVADLQDEKYKGFIGRIKYCLTPYGFIDFISTYPSGLSLFTSFSPVIFKSLRVLRLLRVFRFMKAFRLLGNAISNKKQEMMLSMGFLIVVTFMLSLVLFFVENQANPERYSTGMDSMLWAFMQYINDPGHFAENPPETVVGRIISCFVGVLGIAVFAVPAGLIGSGFIEEMEETRRVENNAKNAANIRKSFQRQRCRHTLYQTVPIYLTIPQLQVYTRLGTEEIMSAIDSVPDLRLVNVASCINIEDNPQDQLAVEHFIVNRSYGCFINRGSKITIVDTSSFVEMGMGNFAFYLAMIGGFNYISRELGSVRPYNSYYIYENESVEPNLSAFMADLNSLVNQEDHYMFCILAASGAMEPKLPTEVHFNYGGKKGDETYNDPGITLHRIDDFENFYQHVSQDLLDQLSLKSDKQRYYDTSGKNNIMRKLKHWDKVNSISLRIKWPFICGDLRRYKFAYVLADNMCKYLEGKELVVDPILKVKGLAYEGYEIS